MFASLLSAIRDRRPSGKTGIRPQRRGVRPNLEALEDRLALSAAPAAPVFSATAVSSSQIDLAWNPVAGATSYQIEEAVGGQWRQLGSLSSSTTAVGVTGLRAGTTYDFDVVASNSAGSHWGTQQLATTRAAASVAIDHPSAATSYSNVSGSLFGSNGPTFTDVQQGAIGDCWLLSSLAEVAARDPNDIRSMFTAAGTAVENGVTVDLYSVRLYDTSGQAHYYTVDTELPSGGNYYDHPASGVLWVALAEKAYVEANGAGAVMTQHRGSDSYSALDGGYGSWGLQAITGKSSGVYSLDTGNLAADMSAGDLVVLGSSSSASSPYIVGDSTGTHAYAVVGYNPSSSAPFEVYNPWGTNSSGWALGTFHGRQVYGLFWATAAFLSQNFASQAAGTGDEADAADAGSTVVTTDAVPTGMTSDSAAPESAPAPSAARQASDLFFASGLAVTPNSAPRAAGAGDQDGTASRVAGTTPADFQTAGYGVWGWKSQAVGGTTGLTDARYSADPSDDDAVWADVGNPESAALLRYSTFAPRIA